MIHHLLRAVVHAATRPLGIVALTCVMGLVGVNVWIARSDAHFVINITASLPLGLYRVEALRGQPQVGELVLSCLPVAAQAFARAHSLDVGGDPNHLGPCRGDFAPVLKYVAATAGAHVFVNNTSVTIDGRPVPHSRPLGALASGIALPRPPPLVVRTGQVFVLAPAAHSFDSRYWGAVIPLAKATPIFTWGGQL